MLVATIVGARPQFIKAAVVSRALAARGVEELLIHTGQHYDIRLSDVFFSELGLPEPYYNLGIGSATHGRQTGQMLVAIEDVLLRHSPDMALVYGDTNSTLAGALAAAKLRIPLAHVEAGMRSGDRSMPEEINRILTDHAADLLLTATPTAVENLAAEGLTEGVVPTGDVMYDLWLAKRPIFEGMKPKLLENFGLREGGFVLATIHRPRNADDPARLTAILDALLGHDEPVFLPLHPRTRKNLEAAGLLEKYAEMLREPVGYLEMQALLGGARLAVTDSGGLQKEAYFHGRPCLTLMPGSEWVETVRAGWNKLIEPEGLPAALKNFSPTGERPRVFGEGDAAERVAGALVGYRR
ncbi:MAG: UDP-N-acetylglucosamine 2-epimerase (non-hydrolyzing) [bacterium]|nr:UDP-N-acetylglucosamine 2-epimerase (non-hydrolyzing) [bacterium]